MRKLIFGLTGLILLSGCSLAEDTKSAQSAIETFHQNINAGNFDRIYQISDAQMKAVATEAQLTQLLTAVHKKLGLYKSGTQGGVNDNVTPNGHFVNIRFAAKYERGDAAENFLVKISPSGEARLVGYHINSMALITN